MSQFIRLKWGLGGDIVNEIVRTDLIRCVYIEQPEETSIVYRIEYDEERASRCRTEHFANRSDCLWRYNYVSAVLTGECDPSPYFRPIGEKEQEQQEEEADG